MSKQISINEAVSRIKSGMTVMVGGFLAVGSPKKILDELLRTEVTDLTIITNDTAFQDKGVGKLIAARKVKKVITSHIGTNPATGEQYNNGTLQIEFVPQGTLGERIRSGGAGLGGVLTPVGLGTVIEEGKQIVNVDGKDFLLEKPLRAQVALVGASVSDASGNLYWKGNSKNFNPLMATAADLVIVEAEEIVPVGDILPENVHLPYIYVNYIVN
ncbi:MAG: CoA transferase subunit A [Bacteroidales bacterium]|jgi:acetate CoA/acetoacetate CoA-transferase alpha subunit|nr:CoA transferase subunit A [Bacteroidales bacterium]MDD4257224.1 CoA transferase subunit A [Bacteroidales bacterium]MDD4655442.1 CoA transferase subunit A [Bacteroidales bacterium]MDD4827374.1 CoA transferase subunit A [Bacteroidales bacterium]